MFLDSRVLDDATLGTVFAHVGEVAKREGITYSGRQEGNDAFELLLLEHGTRSAVCTIERVRRRERKPEESMPIPSMMRLDEESIACIVNPFVPARDTRTLVPRRYLVSSSSLIGERRILPVQTNMICV